MRDNEVLIYYSCFFNQFCFEVKFPFAKTWFVISFFVDSLAWRDDNEKIT